MIHRVLGTSRFLVILAVVGAFLASATLQVFGLARSIAVILDLLAAREATAEVGKGLIADTVAIIDIFLIGTVLFVISAGLYQLFVHPDLELPGWLTIGSLDDLKNDLTEVIVVALLVAFLGQVIEWRGDVAIFGLGIAIASVTLAVAALTWVTHGPSVHARTQQPPASGTPDASL